MSAKSEIPMGPGNEDGEDLEVLVSMACHTSMSAFVRTVEAGLREDGDGDLFEPG